MPGDDREGAEEADEERLLTLAFKVYRKTRALNRDLTKDDIKDMLRAALTSADAFLNIEVRRKEREQGGRP
jgi:hypothetical protein